MPANPTISRKEDVVYTVTDRAKRLFQVIYQEKNKDKENIDDDEPKIKVSSFISKMAFYYEKIRNSVDYKEEHLHRKNAILRILKRQIVIEGVLKEQKIEDIAKHLMTELIRAGYLPNNEIPETKIDEIIPVIDKYLKLRAYALPLIKEEREKDEQNKWILSMCASELEERLNNNPVSQTIINQMYDILRKNTKLPETSAYVNDKEIQIYIGIYRIYLKFDKDMIEFLLLKYFNSNWLDASSEDIKRVAANFQLLRQAILKQLNHPLSGQLSRIISRYTVYFTILEDVINDDPAGVYEGFTEDPKAFPRQIKKFCNLRYVASKAKLRRAAVRSIIYIFLTKMVLAFILEVPVTLWLHEPLNYLSLAINIIFPPLLLFTIVLFTRLPSDANSKKIVDGIEEIVFVEKQKKEPFILRAPAKRTGSINTVFGVIYAITFFVSFGLVVWGLTKIHFNYVSIIIFLFFLTLVSFFSIRIRKVARELIIVETKDNFFGFLVDFFYVPIVAVGKWLNEKFSRINFFVFVLDFIIEAPFKVFVEVADEWTKYVKERKDQIE